MEQKTWKLVFTITDESDSDNLLSKGDIEEICEDVKTEMEKFTKPPLKVEYTIEKNWDVTFVKYRSEVIDADTEEAARAIAEEQKEAGERVGVIEECEE